MTSPQSSVFNATGDGPRSLGFDQELTVSNRVGTFVKGERINGIPYLYDGFHTRSPGGEITGLFAIYDTMQYI